MKKLLVIRNDRLGDLMLILPALRIIKSSIPDIEIDCLADESYKDLSLLSGDIDDNDTVHITAGSDGLIVGDRVGTSGITPPEDVVVH